MSEQKHVSQGVFRNDLAENSNVLIKFVPQLVKNEIFVGLSKPHDSHVFGSHLLAVHFENIKDKKNHVEGSATIVAPGIALTAKHVIEPHLEQIESGEYAFICTAFTSHGITFWRVRSITPISHTDIAVLALSYASDLPPKNIFPVGTITTKLPEVGEKMLILGSRAPDNGAYSNSESNGKKSYLIDIDVWGANGYVTQVFKKGRDSFRMPWASIEIDCEAVGSMSGGPVYNSRGFLVGIISSSIEPGGPVYASLIEPILIESFPGGWPPKWFPNSHRLIDRITYTLNYDPHQADR